MDRIVTIQPGMKKIEIENRYLETFMDRDVKTVLNAEKKYELIDRRANLKARLKTVKTKEEEEDLKAKIADITQQLEAKEI